MEFTNVVEWQDWFVRINKPTLQEMWHFQPTFLMANILYLTMAFMSFKFAVRHGWNSRYTYMWFAALLHGIVTEVISYNLPDINNFWHSQTSLIFLGQRFPLYIVLFYPATITHAYIAAERLKLPGWVEPFAVGLFDLLIDFPYDILGIKLLWWTWHDTDLNIGDRHYWVPWTSYFFHMSFHSTFTALLNGSRYLLTGSSDKKVASGGFFKESLCVVITALFSMAFAVLFQMLPIYHGLKDGFGLHGEIIVCVVIAFYAMLVIWHDRNPPSNARTQKKKTWSEFFKSETACILTVYYLFYMVLVVFARPENERAYGMHEPLGPSSVKVDQYAASGVVYTKQKYLDPHDFDEGYFDFRCTEINGVRGPPNFTATPEVVGADWYAVCGTVLPNRAEYVVVVWSFCIIAMFAFYNALCRSSDVDAVASTPEKSVVTATAGAREQEPTQKNAAKPRKRKKKKLA